MATATDPRAELVRTLAALVEEPREEHARLAALLELPGSPAPGEYTEIFVLNLYPYASVHLGSQGMLGGEARDRVAGFWRALGILPPTEPDHLGVLLGLLASVMDREEEEADPAAALLLARARKTLVREHLLTWLPPWLDRVQALAGPYYRRWAELVKTVLAEEAARGNGLPADAHRRAEEEAPIHLREVPPLPDPRVGEDGEAFLLALLAPVRSGMILTRRDLARAAGELALGLRQGERLYILKALLGQDPAGTLDWLAREARRWSERHRESAHPDKEIAGFWMERAEATATLLRELAAEEESKSPNEPADPAGERTDA